MQQQQQQQQQAGSMAADPLGGGPVSIDPSTDDLILSRIAPYLQINPSIVLFAQQPQLKKARSDGRRPRDSRGALLRRLSCHAQRLTHTPTTLLIFSLSLSLSVSLGHQIIAPVVERSVTIACIASRELVLKDFAMEPDEQKMRSAGHQIVMTLAGSLALVTCKEPLRVSIAHHLRTLLQPHVNEVRRASHSRSWHRPAHCLQTELLAPSWTGNVGSCRSCGATSLCRQPRPCVQAGREGRHGEGRAGDGRAPHGCRHPSSQEASRAWPCAAVL